MPHMHRGVTTRAVRLFRKLLMIITNSVTNLQHIFQTIFSSLFWFEFWNNKCIYKCPVKSGGWDTNVYFSFHWTYSSEEALPAFAGLPSRQADTISPEDVQCAIGELHSGLVSGCDGKPAEVFKWTADLSAHTTANMFN